MIIILSLLFFFFLHFGLLKNHTHIIFLPYIFYKFLEILGILLTQEINLVMLGHLLPTHIKKDKWNTQLYIKRIAYWALDFLPFL